MSLQNLLETVILGAWGTNESAKFSMNAERVWSISIADGEGGLTRYEGENLFDLATRCRDLEGYPS